MRYKGGFAGGEVRGFADSLWNWLGTFCTNVPFPVVPFPIRNSRNRHAGNNFPQFFLPPRGPPARTPVPRQPASFFVPIPQSKACCAAIGLVSNLCGPERIASRFSSPPFRIASFHPYRIWEPFPRLSTGLSKRWRSEVKKKNSDSQKGSSRTARDKRKNPPTSPSF
jgi:hypothetical protein